MKRAVEATLIVEVADDATSDDALGVLLAAVAGADIAGDGKVLASLPIGKARLLDEAEAKRFVEGGQFKR